MEYCKAIILQLKINKDQNKWKSEVTTSGEYSKWVKSFPAKLQVFAWLSKKHAVLWYPDGRSHVFHWLILDSFVECCFQLV